MDSTAIAAIIIGLGATLAAMVMPMKYPDAPPWAINGSWYGGIFLMVCGLAYLLWGGLATEGDGSKATNLALMEVARWEFDTPDSKRPKQYLANLYVVNRGGEDALELRNDGMVLFESPDLSRRIIDEYFGQIKSRILSQSSEALAGPVHPGQSTVWFSVYSNQPTNSQFNGIKIGNIVPYAFGVMKYRDKNTPNKKFIYTESCAYTPSNGVPVLCGRGENRSYIAD